MNGLIKAIALGAVRSLAMAAGAYLLHKGYLDQSAVTGVEGSICCLASAGFTVYDKFAVQGQVHTALMTPPPS